MCSTVKEFDERCFGGRGAGEREEESELLEVCDALRGGKGGAAGARDCRALSIVMSKRHLQHKPKLKTHI